MLEFLDDFLKSEVKKSKIFPHLKCSVEEAKILKYMTKKYLTSDEEVNVFELLVELYGEKDYEYIKRLPLIKNLLDLGWIIYGSFSNFQTNENTNLELLHANITLSISFLKLLEDGNLEFALPDIKPYSDHLEYLKDQFARIELYQKLSTSKHNLNTKSPNISRVQNELKLLEKIIDERIKVTKNEIEVEKIFKEHHLSDKEKIIFLALLKEEYSASEGTLRDMNALIDLISFNDYERIENRSLLEDNSKLIEEKIVDYDEVLNPFGGISRTFFIPEDILQRVIYPNKKRKSKKIKLNMLIKNQDIFELIEPKTTLNDVVLNEETKKTLNSLLKQMDKKVLNRLKEWGITQKKRGIDAKIIFYGPPGTGKTLTALSFAKSLKKQVLSLDCSKILSMYVGESEKNVRKIFDTYKDLTKQSKTEPVLLLNEADQFLSARTSSPGSSADKMHNQMQNIFLEQIERFEGVLIATTNLLETIDTAFSRRFNYKIEFKKPTFKERIKLWEMMLPKSAKFEKDFDIKKLAKFNLTGGQINLVVKNCAYKVAVKDEPIFTMQDFIEEIKKERASTFEYEKSMGFLN